MRELRRSHGTALHPPATTRPLDLWPGPSPPPLPSRLSHSLGITPWRAESFLPPGCASTEMENVKGTLLRQLTAKKPLQLQLTLTQQLHLRIPTLGGLLLFCLVLVDLGGQFNPLSLLAFGLVFRKDIYYV